MAFSKKIRAEVFAKYNRHCAYCGCELDNNSMQIDHIFPVAKNGINGIENLNPSCRQCNFYKSTFTIQEFREQLYKLVERLQKVFIFRLALKHNLISINNQDVKFYYEKVQDGKNN